MEVNEPIAARLMKLNQLLTGRSSTPNSKTLVSYDGLIDSLHVLFEECSSEYLTRNQYVTQFVKKYSSLITELKSLRLSVSDFELKGIIGRGHFGEVQVVTEKYTGDVYAMKIMRKVDMLSQQNVSFYEEERDIMAKATSPWITQLHYAFQNRRNLYLVMDYHPGGDLFSLLARHDDVFEESMARFYAAEMVLALHALHLMGYVHRDVKPENILIDRTGHVKLADFGSACRIADSSSNVSNMPVGTRDYICPEVLTRINGNDGRGKFGEECDWWSLGVCAFEMLYGQTPFTDHDSGSMVVTCANIMNYKKFLKFPANSSVSSSAKDLIQGLLSDPVSRLKYDQIRVHGFFMDIDFDNIRQTRPPFIPTVFSSDDTSNFEDFTKSKSVHFADLPDKRSEFSGKDLPFVGFTFTKNLPSSARSSFETLGESNACRNTLERKLTLKSNELQGFRDNFKELESQNQSLKSKLEDAKKTIREQEDKLRVLTDERNDLERNFTIHLTENNSLKRSLNFEREKILSTELKAKQDITELTQTLQREQKLQEERFNQQLDEFRDIVSQLEEEQETKSKKISRLEREIKHLEELKKSAASGDVQINEIRTKVKVEFKEAYRSKLKEITEKMKKQEHDFANREAQLRSKADQATKQYYDVKQRFQQVSAEKELLETELGSLLDQCSLNNSRLSISEDRCKSLESQLYKVKLLERREQELTGQLKEKSNQVISLATRIADLEEEVQRLRDEKSEVENQSMIIFAENEERLQMVHEQESVILLLKTNVNTLEQHINSLKSDLLEARSSAFPRSTSRVNQDVKNSPVKETLRISAGTSPVKFKAAENDFGSEAGDSRQGDDGENSRKLKSTVEFTFASHKPSRKITVKRDLSGSSVECSETFEADSECDSKANEGFLRNESDDAQTSCLLLESCANKSSVDVQTSLCMNKREPSTKLTVESQTSFISPKKRSMQVQTSFVAERSPSPKKRSMQAQTSFVRDCSPKKRSMQAQTSFCERSASPEKRSMQAQTSFIRERNASPERKSMQAQTSFRERSASPERKSMQAQTSFIRERRASPERKSMQAQTSFRERSPEKRSMQAQTSFQERSASPEKRSMQAQTSFRERSASPEKRSMQAQTSFIRERSASPKKRSLQVQTSFISERSPSPKKRSFQVQTSFDLGPKKRSMELSEISEHSNSDGSHEESFLSQLTATETSVTVNGISNPRKASMHADLEASSELDSSVTSRSTEASSDQSLMSSTSSCAKVVNVSMSCKKNKAAPLLSETSIKSSQNQNSVSHKSKWSARESVGNLDDLVEANSDTSCTIDVTFSAKLKCRHVKKTAPVTDAVAAPVLSRVDECQNVGTDPYGNLQEQLNESCYSIQDAQNVRICQELIQKHCDEKEELGNTVRLLEKEKRELEQHVTNLQNVVHSLNNVESQPVDTNENLQQEKERLEKLVEQLEKEIEMIKDSTHEQRIRVLDLKHELREKTSTSEKEIADLQFRLNKAESAAKDQEESSCRWKEREMELKKNLDNTKEELYRVSNENAQTTMRLEGCISSLEVQLEKLKLQLETQDRNDVELNEAIEKSKLDLEKSHEKVATMEARIKELEALLQSMRVENGQFQLNIERSNEELTESINENERLMKEVDQLKSLCKELESQIGVLEMLVEHWNNEIEKMKSQENIFESSQKADLNRAVAELELVRGQLAQQKLKSDSLASQVINLEHRQSTLGLENQSLKCQLDGTSQGAKKLKDDIENSMKVLLEDKNRLLKDAEATKKVVDEKENQIQELKYLCCELESQIKLLETIDKDKERRLSRLMTEEGVYKKAVDEQESEMDKLQRHLKAETQGRKRCEQRIEELVKRLDRVSTDSNTEKVQLKVQISEMSIKAESLNRQLDASERKCSLLELDMKNLRRCLETREQELNMLKEEVSKEITRLQSLKTTNLSLAKDLENANERYEILSVKKADLENQIERLQANFQHDKYRMDETLSQQAKLIDFLQAKVESTPRKKLFSGKRSDGSGSAIQLREALSSLEHEREKNGSLRHDIVKLQEELNQAKTEAMKLKCKANSKPPIAPSTATGYQSNTLPAGIQSNTLPSYKTTHSGSATPGTSTPRHQSPAVNQKVPTHKFHTGINSRPTKCIVCLGSIHFVQQAAKCQDCGAVCHPKCLPELPFNCGVSSEYVRYTSEVMSRASMAVPDENNLPSVAGLRLQMSGYMKVPRSSKQNWEKKWVILKDNKLFVYNNRQDVTSSLVVDEFDLCPSNGDVSIQSAVTAAELNNISVSDLPYILMIQFDPDTTCWPARSLYLMALNFKEKQQWVAAIEAIVSTNVNSTKIKDVKVLGNTMLRLSKNKGLEINCTWPFNDNVIMIGATTGLYAMMLMNEPDNRPLVKIEGFNSIHAIEALPESDLVLIVTGQDRELSKFNLSSIHHSLSQSKKGNKEPVVIRPLDSGSACTVFAVKQTQDGLFVCAATVDKIILYKFNSSLKDFCIRREISSSQPCSCMHFGEERVIVGTNKFYQIDLDKYVLSEFLDKSDSSLAFAVFGAAQYDSFPIAVLAVNEPNDPEEFLICFHEFGVFVDGSGRRSREQNVKWTGLPLAFAFRKPFLYTIHYNAIQLMEIMPRDHNSNPIGMKTFVNIPGAHYLGPAVMSGAVYIGSTSTDRTAEVICIKGNRATAAVSAVPKRFSKHSGIDTKSMESGFVSPRESTPSAIRKISTRFSQSDDRSSVYSSGISDGASSSTDSLAPGGKCSSYV